MNPNIYVCIIENIDICKMCVPEKEGKCVDWKMVRWNEWVDRDNEEYYIGKSRTTSSHVETWELK